MTAALLTADEAARLTVGVNVIVRAGDTGHPINTADGPPGMVCGPCRRAPHLYQTPPWWGQGDGCPCCASHHRPEFVAPRDWLALTGPCPTCNGHGHWFDIGPIPSKKVDCPDCRDGRKLADFGDGVKAIVVSVEPEPDGRNWRITLEVPE